MLKYDFPLCEPGTVIHEALGTVDFKPTLLGLLGVDSEEVNEGRDAAVLFREGKAPENWQDIAFVRIGEAGRRAGKSWFGAFTSKHKLVLSASDPPGFFDLEKDPNELSNRFKVPEYRAEIRRLAQALKAYGEKYREPHMATKAVQADLEWAISERGAYDVPAR